MLGGTGAYAAIVVLKVVLESMLLDVMGVVVTRPCLR